MEQSVQTTLASFSTRQTTAGMVFLAFDQYGTEYSMWAQALWQELQQHLGQPVVLVYESKPSRDGKTEYRTAKSFQAMNGPVPAPIAPIPVPAVPNVFATAEQPPVAPAVPVATVEYQRLKHPDEQRAIRKAVALNNAVAALPLLEKKPAAPTSKDDLTGPNQVLAIAEVWERWLAGEL
jgi:hypothetical protein